MQVVTDVRLEPSLRQFLQQHEVLASLEFGLRACPVLGPNPGGVSVPSLEQLGAVLQGSSFGIKPETAERIAGAVLEAELRDCGYAPYNGTHTHYRVVLVSNAGPGQYRLGRGESPDAALLSFAQETGGVFWGDGVNMDAATRTKCCGEITALAQVVAEQAGVEGLVLRAVCNREGEERRRVVLATPPCGNCRTAFLPHTTAQLPVVLVPSDRREGGAIYVTTMGGLLPLAYLGADWVTEARALVGLPELSSLRILSRSDLRGLAAKALELAEQQLEKSVVPFSRTRAGATVVTVDGKLHSAPRVELSPIEGGVGAPVGALKKAIKAGTTLFQLAVFSSELDHRTGGPVTPDGVDRQYLFEFAQLMGIDLPVLMTVPGNDTVLLCSSSELFPMGRGPRGSSVPAQVDRYRMVNEVVVQ